MTWRARYRVGSFRGVPFTTQNNETAGGRRVETHEFPRRDRPWTEDLGRAARRWSLELFVAGAAYLDARDRLIAAFDAAGAGILVHPWDGTLSVSVEDWTCRDSTDEGGLAYFTVQFVEAGQVLDGAVAPDTRDLVVAAADAAAAAAPARFAERFDVSGMAGFVEDAAAQAVRRTAMVAAIAGGLQGGIGPALRAFEAGLLLLPAGTLALVRSPVQLGHAIVGLIAAIGALGGTSVARIAGLSILVDQPVAAVIGATPARARQRANAAAYATLVASVAAAELVRAVADAPVASYQDAVALRDGVTDLLEARVIASADAGDDAGAATFAGLLRVMVADVAARGGTLARVYRHIPARTEPALVIAARLYGPGGAMIDRAADLVARNRVRHPGFVLGGMPIDVLELGGG